MFDLTKAKAQYTKAKKAYFEGDTEIMTDAEFDILENKIRKADPDWKGLHKTGAPVKHKEKVVLARKMPSLNKVYPEQVGSWMAKNKSNTYYAMHKLDGTSLQLVVENGKASRLHTRGDGEIGKDVSHLLPYVGSGWGFPRGLNAELRMEAVMSKRDYKKWAHEFDNARQLVNGVFNRKQPHPALADISLVVLGVYGKTIREGLATANNWNMDTVTTVDVDGSESYAKALEVILDKAKKAVFEVDGLVIATSDFVLDYKSNDKPKSGIVAFKVNAEDEMVEATVKEIIWQVTGRGRIVPKIKIAPTPMNGVMVQYATAHNAKMMLDKKIGPGAVVKMVRSGGVIPYIVEVLKPGKIQNPTVPFELEGVHYVVTEEADDSTLDRIEILNLVKFFTTLGIEGLKAKNLTALYGVIQEPAHYVRIWKEGKLTKTLSHVMGANAAKVTQSFDAVFSKPVHVRDLLPALQVYGVGIGKRKLQQIEDAGVSLACLTNDRLVDVQDVPGFAEKTYKLLVKGKLHARIQLKLFKQLGIELDTSLPTKKAKPSTGKLVGLLVSFTGYRDKDQEAKVAAMGAEVISYGGKTTVLLYKDGGKASSKVEAARKKGIKVCTFEELTK
jgi:DNA ligase (NAD+)